MENFVDRNALLNFIEKTEASLFRTNMDTGANPNALIVWNHLREFAGLDDLTHKDLQQRHADDRGITLEEQQEDERKMREFLRERNRGNY